MFNYDLKNRNQLFALFFNKNHNNDKIQRKYIQSFCFVHLWYENKTEKVNILFFCVADWKSDAPLDHDCQGSSSKYERLSRQIMSGTETQPACVHTLKHPAARKTLTGPGL